MINSPTFPALRFPHLSDAPLPKLQRVRIHHRTGTPIGAVAGCVTDALEKSQKIGCLPPNSEVAIAVGSRGISGIVHVVKATVDYLVARGLRPFIVPAMGSHGGASPAGQTALLASLGITRENTGAEIRASMETVVYGETADGIACHFDRNASEAAGIIVVNRVKSHTSFDRPNESGLVKMLAVGLGKEQGARNVHRLGPPGLSKVLPQLARIALDRAPVVFGIALVENADKDLVVIEGVEPRDFFAADERLLTTAKSFLAKLPFREIDALVVELIGKDISGAGMDHAVTGRADIRGVANPAEPFISKIAVLGLTAGSHGNGLGVGLADFTTLDLVGRLDLQTIYMNSLTSTLCEKARMPIVLPTERDAVSAAVVTSWAKSPAEAKLCVIRSTLHLNEVLASPALLAAHGKDPRLTLVAGPVPMEFGQDGRLLTRCS